MSSEQKRLWRMSVGEDFWIVARSRDEAVRHWNLLATSEGWDEEEASFRDSELTEVEPGDTLRVDGVEKTAAEWTAENQEGVLCSSAWI